MIVSTVTTVSIQITFTAMLTRLRTEVLCISITYKTCSFSVVNPVNESDVYHFFCFVHNLKQPNSGYGSPFSHTSIMAYSINDLRQPVSGNLPKILVQNKNGFVTSIAVSFCIEINYSYTKLTEMLFLKQASHSTVNAYLEILVLLMVTSKNFNTCIAPKTN